MGGSRPGRAGGGRWVMSQPDKFARFADTKAVSDDLKRKSVVGALTTGAGGAVDFVLRLGSTLVLARLLVPEDFGLVAMVTAITAIAEYFSTLGLSTATVQAPDITHGQCSNLFWINVAAGLLFRDAGSCFPPAIAAFYDDPRLETIAVAISLNFVFTGLDRTTRGVASPTDEAAADRRESATWRHFSACASDRACVERLRLFGPWSGRRCAALSRCARVLGPLSVASGLPSRRVDMDRLLRFGRDMTLTQLLIAASEQLDSLLIGRFVGATLWACIARRTT